MELDDFIVLLDRVNRANTIPEVVELLAEIDALPNLDKRERKILDECLDESVEIGLYHDRWGNYFEQRYGSEAATDTGGVSVDATPETIIISEPIRSSKK